MMAACTSIIAEAAAASLPACIAVDAGSSNPLRRVGIMLPTESDVVEFDPCTVERCDIDTKAWAHMHGLWPKQAQQRMEDGS